MTLLAEYALTPDVFDSRSYSNEELGSVHLQHLKEALLNEALVRNLRNGQWLDVFNDNDRPWHRRGKELLKKLVQQGRLRLCNSVLSDEPTTDHAWCREALASHHSLPLNGIVATRVVASRFQDEPLVARIDRLPSASWWARRSSSVRLARTAAEYTRHLHLLLKCANSIMFIDPHIDPTRRRYSDFIQLLREMSGRTPAPLIEIHRVCYFESRNKRDQLNEEEWKRMFSPWSADLQSVGLAVHVFIWDDFHDRYVISNLVGISVPNGFDTTQDPNQMTTWTRLGRNERDDIQREFDPASNRHTLRHRFRVPG